MGNRERGKEDGKLLRMEANAPFAGSSDNETDLFSAHNQRHEFS
jgi:hypothetical protein